MRLYWQLPGRRLYGRVVDRRHHGTTTLVDVRWDDGRLGSFVEGHEPEELHIASARGGQA